MSEEMEVPGEGRREVSGEKGVSGEGRGGVSGEEGHLPGNRSSEMSDAACSRRAAHLKDWFSHPYICSTTQ